MPRRAAGRCTSRTTGSASTPARRRCRSIRSGWGPPDPPRACSAALAGADLVLVAPSNPVVSIGPILAVPGMREAVRATPAPVIGFAGILGGAPVLGMAHRLLPAIGVATEAAAVGRHYGARSAGGVLDVWAMDSADAAAAGSVTAAGLRPVVTDLLMTDPPTTAAFLRHVVEAGLS